MKHNEADEYETLMREGREIRKANQIEQIENWAERHGFELRLDSASDILAARDVDHAEAIRWNDLNLWMLGHAPEEYAGAHYFRASLDAWDRRCQYPDCNGRVGSPVHVTDRPRIESAHHSAIMEDQLRTTGPIGMGRR